MKTAPLLSIGMIFKNEERCLERCLKSLEPLRKAIPCELIMADTGAEDGSRAIAEKYADEVFDFAWIDDFAAARNAVMDRCHGKWYFSIDCDEWLDHDISELTEFLHGKSKVDFAFVMLRDYFSEELEKSEHYSDFQALRLIRMATGRRYAGAIHESWVYYEPTARLNHTFLHHDGYFYTNPEARKKKKQRNMKLLRQKLKQEPNNLRTLNQCIESGGDDPDFIQYIRRGIALVKSGNGQLENYGPLILSHAVETARVLKMEELEEWIKLAETMFPGSMYTQVAVNHTAFLAAHDKKDWAAAVWYGERYREGLHSFCAYRQSKRNAMDLTTGSPRSSDPVSERTLLIGLTDAYRQTAQPEKALKTFMGLEGEKLLDFQLRSAIVALSQLHAETEIDVFPTLTNFYHQISQETPDKQKKLIRLAVFDEISAAAFSHEYQEEEEKHDNYRRPAYTAFACLADQCEAGRGAKIMTSNDPAEMREWLLKVEDWQALPIEALEHALSAGVTFPLEEKPLSIEVMDGLAARLTHDGNTARQMALALPEGAKFERPQSLAWAQSLALAAVRSFDWSLGKNSAPMSRFACPEKPKEEDDFQKPLDTPEVGLVLVRCFAQVERALLPLLYAPALLTEENAALLPPMHRWGLYCTRALEALDGGNPQEYVATLRKGLADCPGQKEMVQFLLDRFLEDTRPKANPELLALAEKVRAILAAYGPNHPAARAIRESDAYKQVAWIIEETPGIPVQ